MYHPYVHVRHRCVRHGLQHLNKQLYARVAHEDMSDQQLSRVGREWIANHDPQSPLVLSE